MAQVWYFVPDEKIDAVVLSFYLAEFVDKRAQLRPGKHDVAQRTGWHISSKDVLTKEDLVCIVRDTKDWLRESKVGSVLHYVNSKTAAARRQAGRGRYATPPAEDVGPRETPRNRDGRDKHSQGRHDKNRVRIPSPPRQAPRDAYDDDEEDESKLFSSRSYLERDLSSSRRYQDMDDYDEDEEEARYNFSRSYLKRDLPRRLYGDDNYDRYRATERPCRPELHRSPVPRG